MTQNDALKCAEYMLAPMSKPEGARVWVRREITGDHIVGIAVEGGPWVERWTAKSYKSALNRVARAILKCMPYGECANRAHTYLNGSR